MCTMVVEAVNIRVSGVKDIQELSTLALRHFCKSTAFQNFKVCLKKIE